MSLLTRDVMSGKLYNIYPEYFQQHIHKFNIQFFFHLVMILGYMEGAMESTTSISTPPDQVDQLIRMVGDEYQLETGSMLDNVGNVGTNLPVSEAKGKNVCYSMILSKFMI